MAKMLTAHFSEDEMRCRCGCGLSMMDDSFMRWLEAVRVRLKKPMIVSSGFRCPDYNGRMSSTGRDGPHTTGCAADIAIRGADAHRLVRIALEMSVQGLGINQKGEGRFIHLDVLMDWETEGPRPWIWSY